MKTRNAPSIPPRLTSSSGSKVSGKHFIKKASMNALSLLESWEKGTLRLSTRFSA